MAMATSSSGNSETNADSVMAAATSPPRTSPKRFWTWRLVASHFHRWGRDFSRSSTPSVYPSGSTFAPVDLNAVDPARLPVHVGIVMDGNGRWATKRGLPRTAGHKAGEDALFEVVEG